MWTTTILAAKKENKIGAFISVAFDNSDDKTLSFVEDFPVQFQNPDMEWLKRQIKSRIDTLDSIYTFADSIKAGPIDSTPAEVTPIAVPPDAKL